MTIEQLAKQLGNAIKGDERMVRFNKAKKAFEDDVALGRMAIEFEIQQKALANRERRGSYHKHSEESSGAL